MRLGRTLRSALSIEGALALLAAGGVVFTWMWVRAAFAMANRGFDLSDEGSYVLAYRWWSTNYRNYTGTQFFYGPIFQLLGWDVAKLRMVRVVTILAAHATFGWAFMDWLRLRRPRAPKSSLWELSGVAAILAASGMLMSWLPLSPGYNDIGLLGAVLATTIVIRIAQRIETGTPIGIALPLLFGPIVAITLLAKWAALITTFGPVGLVALIVLSACGIREIARVVMWTLAGIAGSFLFLQIFVVRLDKAIPEMMEVTRLVALTANSPSYLLEMYWSSSKGMVNTVLERYEILIIAAAVAAVARSRATQVIAALLGIIAVNRFFDRVKMDGALTGGTANLARYTVAILAIAMAVLAMLVAGAVTGYLSRANRPSIAKESLRGWAVLALVAGIPITHGFGTGNPLYVMIVNGFGAWMAITVAVATGLDTRGRVARWFGCAIAALGVYAAVTITKTGLLEYPYRVDAFNAATTKPSDVPLLRNQRLSPDKAYRYGTLHRAIAPYIDPPGRAMMAFDELSGLTFFLDSRPVGEPWYATVDHPRTAENLRASCRGGHPWWESRWPILVFQRGITDVEIRALKDCGIDFATEYRLVAPTSQTIGLGVYAPAKEVAERSAAP